MHCTAQIQTAVHSYESSKEYLHKRVIPAFFTGMDEAGTASTGSQMSWAEPSQDWETPSQKGCSAEHMHCTFCSPEPHTHFK